jgi:hypothetical protein
MRPLARVTRVAFKRQFVNGLVTPYSNFESNEDPWMRSSGFYEAGVAGSKPAPPTSKRSGCSAAFGLVAGCGREPGEAVKRLTKMMRTAHCQPRRPGA